MAINDIVQTVAEARVDARSLSEFVFKPAGFKVARRLAPAVDTLQFYINRFNSLNGDFSSSVSVALSSLNNSVAEADGKVAHIETTVQDAINNTAVEGGVLADTFVVVDGNQSQRDVNQKTARTFKKITDLVADTKLKNGQYVNTLSYNTTGDGGGAFYLVSNTATDYSIPLANGLHAVFNDTFDIRKFGIVDNPTLDQTINIERMIAYADTREYEIDFHGFNIMTAKTNVQLKAGGAGLPARGLIFKNVHKLKNLNITHDKSIRLTTYQCMIVFAPMHNPTTEQWFELENVNFDAWVSNYQPHTENYQGTYDGMRLGFIAHPHHDGTISNWSETATNYSFKFTSIHFPSPAYSYNLSTSAIHAKNIEFKNLTGDYLGLYLNYMSQNLIGDYLDSVYRADYIESGRVLVGNAIHYEAELAGKTASYNSVDLKNITGVHKVTGDYYAAFKYHNIGTTSMNSCKFDNIKGAVSFENLAQLKKLTLSNSAGGASIGLHGSVVDVVEINNWESSYNAATYGGRIYLLDRATIGKVTLNNCNLLVGLTTFHSTHVGSCDELIVNNCDIKDAELGLYAGDTGLLVNNIYINGGFVDNPSSKIISGIFDRLEINGTVIKGKSPLGVDNQLALSIVSSRAEVYLNNVVSHAINAPYNGMFAGGVDVKLFNSVFTARPKVEGAAAIVLEHNTYPPAPVVP